MLAALASATLIVATSLTVGQAVLTLCGRPEARAVAGPVGLAAILAASAVVAGLGGGGLAIAIALGALTLPAAAILLRTGLPRIGTEARVVAVAASLLAGLFAALPFIAAGTVGILGVGLVNDDMASHLLLADWIEERFRPEPALIDQGYPLGPHALVTGLGTVLGARSIDVFAGLTLAIPGLTAFLVTGALAGLRPVARTGAAVLVALPYLAAAYLAQEAFKEPILALFVIAFALLLPSVRSPRDGVALGVLAAGVVYVYSFPGLAWPTGVVAVWALLGRWRAPRRPLAVGGLALAVLVLAVAIAPEIPRLIDFADFRALDPDRANEGGLGNLRGHISPLEALGIWPTSDFRVSATAAGAPAPLFYAGALLGAAALALALPRWIARHGSAIPAALITAALLYVVARTFGTVYTSAKALAIAAPLIALITLGGLLDQRGSRSGAPLLAILVALAGAFSSFLVLRQAPVGPEDHMNELAEIRPLVEGEKLLFLGRDNFVLYSLRGSKPFTHVRNFYDPYFVEPNTELRDVFAKFDFDSVTAKTLARFPYVLTTRAAYASGPSPAHERIAQTASYALWEKRGPIGARTPAERDASPGRSGGCPGGPGPKASSRFAAEPVLTKWSAGTVEDGEAATAALRLSPGTWELSVQYDSTRALTLSAPGFEHTLPANLDYRGTTPFWDAGRIDVPRRGSVTVSAEVVAPALAGRLLGADSVAHLGALAATAAGRSRLPGCDGYVDWYVR